MTWHNTWLPGTVQTLGTGNPYVGLQKGATGPDSIVRQLGPEPLLKCPTVKNNKSVLAQLTVVKAR